MGNCIRHESQVQWGGEDWSPALMTDDEKLAMNMKEEVGGSRMTNTTSSKKGSSASTTSKITEVKVKITKKQLEELLGRIDMQHEGLSMQQVVGQLVKCSVQYETNQRSWRPRLQSIPEV